MSSEGSLDVSSLWFGRVIFTKSNTTLRIQVEKSQAQRLDPLHCFTIAGRKKDDVTFEELLGELNLMHLYYTPEEIIWVLDDFPDS